MVVGSGPNGLAAAVELARSGRSVAVLEAASRPGGGMRSGRLTGSAALHDVCSAIHPLAAASPFLSALPLAQHGVDFVHPGAPLAHPLDGAASVTLHRSLDATATDLGRDEGTYRKLFAPLVARTDDVIADLFRPPRPPRHPISFARFISRGIHPVGKLASRFSDERTRALLAGVAAHSVLALERRGTAAVAQLMVMLGHAVGWPLIRGGSQKLADGLGSYLRALGGEIFCDRPVASMRDLPAARAILFDVSPPALARIAGDELPSRYRRKLARFRFGTAVFKVDFDLDGPVPWAASDCASAATVHVGGSFEEIAAAEREVAGGGHPERPFLITAQQSLFDDTRAPAGTHTLWAYCHVPSRSSTDMTERIERQIERFAPGFRDRIVARRSSSPATLERENPNHVGGDITGGVQDLRGYFVRPVLSRVPHATPNRRIYLCSASTPPGGGVHGMCGYHAARAALRRAF